MRKEWIGIQLDTIEVIQIEMTVEFERWLTALQGVLKYRVLVRLRQATAGNLGDTQSVGDGLSEMRLHFGAGYRLYFTQKGKRLIVMLAGGDKGSQQRDIRRAQQLLKGLR